MMILDEPTQTDMTDEQMDEIVAQSEQSTNREIPMTQNEAAPPAAGGQTKPQPPAVQEYEFVHNGKTIKAPVDKILQWAQMGYNYPQRAQELNQQKSQWETQKAEWEKQRQAWEPYKQVDEWAKQNPEHWQRIQESLKAPAQPAQGQPDVYQPKFKAIESELSQIKEFVQSQQAERQAKLRAEEDQKLNQDIQSIRDTFKDLDWDGPDAEGKTLEYRVLEHAQKLNIPSFDAAFKHLMHDQLVARAQTLGKQAVSKNIQAKTRLGVLGESQTPKRGFSEAKDISNKSYEELAREAIEELAQGA